MFSRRIHIVALIMISMGLGMTIHAQETAAEEEPSPEIIAELMKATKGRRGKGMGKEEYPSLEEVVEGMEKREGFFTLYLNEEKQELLAHVPKEALKNEFLIATSMSFGEMTGAQWSNTLVALEEYDRQLLFMQPNSFETASDGGTLEELVDNTYPATILMRADILTKTKDGGVVIDLGDTFRRGSDSLVGFPVGNGMIMTIRKAKSFPENNEVDLLFRNAGSGGGFGGFGMFGGGEPMSDFGVHFSISSLPKTSYKPRVADDRIGYFLDAREDFSQSESSPTRFIRYINRWHIEKADPDLKLSPPKEPIIFYVEKTVPVKYRKAVRDGILEWNKAFEAIGISEAVVVRQQTEDNEFADIDPEDVRYNFFRWVTNRGNYAAGPSRSDPRTGQIYDADIVMDEGMVRGWSDDFDVWIDRAFDDMMPIAERQRYLVKPWEHPNWETISNEYLTQLSLHPEKKMNLTTFMANHLDLTSQMMGNRKGCSMATEARRQYAFASMALNVAMLQTPIALGSNPEVKEDPKAAAAAEGEKKEDAKEGDKKEEKKGPSEDELAELVEQKRADLLYQFVKGVVIHEVGHTLGLRHNFKASTFKTLAQIESAKNDEPLSGSVMDYLPINIPADLNANFGPFDTLVPGPYDMWAIEYGYAFAGLDGRPKDEEKMLAEITKKVADHGMVYGTDEDVPTADPYIVRWDFGSDPLNYARKQMKLAEGVKKEILTRLVKDGQPYYLATQAYRTVMSEYFRAAGIATKFIGGHSLIRTRKGDPGDLKPVTVVPAKIQREALDLIAKNLLAKDAFSLDPELQPYLSSDRWMHRGNEIAGSRSPLFPIQTNVLNLHRRVLTAILSTTTLENLYDAAYRVPAGEDVLSVEEVMTRLTGAICTELAAPATGTFSIQKPMIADIRRNLQREYVGQLIKLALRDDTTAAISIARSLSYDELVKIQEMAKKSVATAGIDAYSRAHLNEMSRRIEKALNADYSIGGGMGSGMPFFLMFGDGGGEAGVFPRNTTGAGLETTVIGR